MIRLACGVVASGAIFALLMLWGPLADDGASVARACLSGALFGALLLPFELVNRRRDRNQS